MIFLHIIVHSAVPGAVHIYIFMIFKILKSCAKTAGELRRERPSVSLFPLFPLLARLFSPSALTASLVQATIDRFPTLHVFSSFGNFLQQRNISHDTNNSVSSLQSLSLRSRRLEVLGTRRNGRATPRVSLARVRFPFAYHFQALIGRLQRLLHMHGRSFFVLVH